MPKKLIKNMAKSKDKNEERDERAKRRSLARETESAGVFDNDGVCNQANANLLFSDATGDPLADNRAECNIKVCKTTIQYFY